MKNKETPKTDEAMESDENSATRELYFGLVREQQKISNLVNSLYRLKALPSEIYEHGNHGHTQINEQYESLSSAQSLLGAESDGDANVLLKSICKSIDKISERTSADELDSRFIDNRLELVTNRFNFLESVVKQVILGLQELVESRCADRFLEIDKLKNIDHELNILESFPSMYLERFDNESYLAAYPDLVPALSSGLFASPVIHFVKHGFSEIKNGDRRLSGDNPIHRLVFGNQDLSDQSVSDTDGKKISALDGSLASADGDGPVGDSNQGDSSESGSKALEIDRRLDRLKAELSSDQADLLETVRASGIVDEEWYKFQNCNCHDPVAHFLLIGRFSECLPNFLFDPAWYFARYLKPASIATAVLRIENTLDELLFSEKDTRSDKDFMIGFYHYVTHGSNVDLPPCPGFEPEWYRRNHFDASLPECPLVQYLRFGPQRGYAPNSVFDVQYYIDQNPDVAKENYDPVKHFYARGWIEERKPAYDFDVSLYTTWYLSDKSGINPLDHYIEYGRDLGLATNQAGFNQFAAVHNQKQSLTGNIKLFSNPGNAFEQPLTGGEDNSEDLASKCIAFYLPQFHEFEENNKWWGDGFSEWRNVARGAPRFKGHNQPRIPRDLGFYNLLNEDVIKRQVELALTNGLHGFCFYYYWFNGKRLMEKPLDIFANSSEIDFPFCIMWANENWTRTWDGHDNEVMIRQDYIEADEDAFIEDTGQYFSHKNYIMVDGRPLFILYRPGLVTDAKSTIERWRGKWEEKFGVSPLIFMVQGFGDTDPRTFELDGAIEFPPHKLVNDLPEVTSEVEHLDGEFSGKVVNYSDVVNRSLLDPVPEYPLIRTVVPSWDNDARREGRGLVLHGSTPQKYQSWLNGACQYSRENPVSGESFVFVNAWNEWAESAYLEPDVHHGHAYLNATRRILRNIPDQKLSRRMLLVGHDANPHGAQMILLGIGRLFKNEFNIQVEFVLKSGGSLLAEYEKVAPVTLIAGMRDDEVINLIDDFGCEAALTNTLVCGDLIPTLKRCGLRVVSLVHELPRIAREYGLIPSANSIATSSDVVVCPSDIVLEAFESYAGELLCDKVVRSQGLYKEMSVDESVRSSVRQRFGIPDNHKIVMNTGFADLRKGFDKFIAFAEKMIPANPDIHFLWVGEIEKNLKHWILSGLSESVSSRIHLVGFSDSVADFCAASDCFFLTSREDPYPTVVLEAMSLGCPAVVYKGCTGLEKLANDYGYVVDADDDDSVVAGVNKALYEDTQESKARRKQHVLSNYRYRDYCYDLLELLDTKLKKVSVVVPNYNYENHIIDRLRSIVNQSYPIYELIVLDDKSSDNSVETIQNFLDRENIDCKLVVNTEQSGNVFRQWKKGLDMASGDLVWIAEADDLCDRLFLETLVSSMEDDTVLGFSNSIQIDENDQFIAGDYNYYYQGIPTLRDNENFSIPGKEFVENCMSVKNPILNVSSVVWNREALSEALSSVGQAVYDFNVVGDWLLYIEVLARKNAKVSYRVAPMNVHRRHGSSVTHSLDYETHLGEVEGIHTHLRNSGFSTEEIESERKQYIEELTKQFGLPTDRVSDDSDQHQNVEAA